MENDEILRNGIVDTYCKPSHYPISNIVLDIARSYGETPFQAVEALGIRNRSQSAKRINRWIGEGLGNDRFLEEFCQLTRTNDSILEALKQTAELRAIEAEARIWRIAKANISGFMPFIEIIPEQAFPNQIFVEAVTRGKFKRVPWDQRQGEEILAARMRAGRMCRAHYLDTEEGGVINWGKVVGYRFVESWNRYIEMDTDGNIIQIVDRPWLPAVSTLSVKGKSGVEKLIKKFC